MKKFINMHFNGTQWWVEYTDNGTYKIDYFNTEEAAQSFYNTFF